MESLRLLFLKKYFLGQGCEKFGPEGSVVAHKIDAAKQQDDQGGEIENGKNGGPPKHRPPVRADGGKHLLF